MTEPGLFDAAVPEDAEDRPAAPSAPLAERLRPRRFEELVGQTAAVGPGSLLRDLVESDRLPSIILWGPPGCGKTSLARLLATRTGLSFRAFSAVLSGVAEVRGIIAEAKVQRRANGRGTLLFVDEIHRFNKAQQDAFLPHVEDGTVVLVGATTENPSFALNKALLSRCRVIELQPLSADALRAIVRRALDDRDASGLPAGIDLDEAAVDELVAASGGDARSLLNRLEAVIVREAGLGELARPRLGAPEVKKALGDPTLRYDRSGDDHFDVMSAFHKSMRGSDPQAALYWLARMIESGEDVAWIARRMIRFASEDVGLAEPEALRHALAALESYRFLGSPEGELALAQAAVYLATCPKSNAIYLAFDAARAAAREGTREVPMHLRNAPTALMRELGRSEGYRYDHDSAEAISGQTFLPDAIAGRRFYEPTAFGHEKEIARRIAWWEKLRAERRGSQSEDRT